MLDPGFRRDDELIEPSFTKRCVEQNSHSHHIL